MGLFGPNQALVALREAHAAVVQSLHAQLAAKDAHIATLTAECDRLRSAPVPVVPVAPDETPSLSPRIRAALAKAGRRLPADVKRQMATEALDLVLDGMDESRIIDRIANGDATDPRVQALVTL